MDGIAKLSVRMIEYQWTHEKKIIHDNFSSDSLIIRHSHYPTIFSPFLFCFPWYYCPMIAFASTAFFQFSLLLSKIQLQEKHWQLGLAHRSDNCIIVSSLVAPQIALSHGKKMKSQSVHLFCLLVSTVALTLFILIWKTARVKFQF